MNKKTAFGMHLAAFLLVSQLSAQTSAPAENANKEEAAKDLVVLNKFEVRKNRDVGYFSANTTAGTRSSMATLDVPGSVSIINAEMLSDLNVVDADQALKYGVSGVTSNEHVRDDSIIRGYRQSHIFRDGVVATSFVVNQLYDVDRLEVVKGPAAMVFGNSGVLGGAVNYVAKKPTYTPQGDAKVTIGAENSYVRSTVNVSGPLSDERKDIRYRLTLGAQNDSRDKQIERLNQLFIGGALDFDFGKSTVSLYGFYIDSDRYIYFNDFLDISKTTGPMVLNKYSTADFNVADDKQNLYFDNKELYVSGQIVTQLSENFTFKGFYRYRSDNEPRRIIRGISMLADNVTLNRQILNFPYSEYGHNVQVDFIYKLTIKNVTQDISFGADYSNVFSRDILAIYPITPLNTAAPDYSADATLLDQYPINSQNQRTTNEGLSYYVQDFAKLWNDKVNLVAGLRWINPKVVQQNLLTNTLTTRDDPMKRVYRYGIVFKPLPKVSVYAMKADTFSINTGVNHLGVALLPSAGKITEFGIKTFDVAFAGGQLFASAAYFDMALTNVTTVGQLVTLPDGRTLNEILQFASETSKGFEFDIGYRHKVGPGDFDAIVTYYDATPKSATGTRTIRAPKLLWGVLAKYAFTDGGLKGLTVGFGASHTGDRLATTGGLYYPEHDLYDMFVQYRLNSRWSFALNIDNLTDERYVATYAAAGLAGANDSRTIRLTTKYAW